jgi:hypothetical protein
LHALVAWLRACGIDAVASVVLLLKSVIAG